MKKARCKMKLLLQCQLCMHWLRTCIPLKIWARISLPFKDAVFIMMRLHRSSKLKIDIVKHGHL